MGLKVGDTLTVNLLGRDITARIANLRQIDWARLGINFAIVFAPGTLEAAPQTHLAAVHVPPAEEEALVRQVTDTFPNISAIPVRDALAAVSQLVGHGRLGDPAGRAVDAGGRGAGARRRGGGRTSAGGCTTR